MAEKDCKKEADDIAKQLGQALAGADLRGGYHPRKGFHQVPPVAGTDPHGVIVWAADQSKKVD